MTLKAHSSDDPNPPDDSDDIGPLGFLRPRETERVIKARGPHRLVVWLRLGLPIGAFVVLIVLILWPVLNPHGLVGIAMKGVPDFIIRNLHFSGLDASNQPYTLLAEKATRVGGKPDIYDLDKPEGEVTLNSGAWVAGKAQYGRFDSTAHKLWLGGDVELFHDNGSQFTTDEAQVDMKDGYAWGEKPVLIQGGFGEIRGQGFRFLDSGKVMVVTGPAHAVLNLRRDTSSDTPAPKRQ